VLPAKARMREVVDIIVTTVDELESRAVSARMQDRGEDAPALLAS